MLAELQTRLGEVAVAKRPAKSRSKHIKVVLLAFAFGVAKVFGTRSVLGWLCALFGLAIVFLLYKELRPTVLKKKAQVGGLLLNSIVMH